ncbi:MAG: hypothetical protein KKA65_03915 [Nanoarchaeota archaeon]|nr:hypothetical protein [Nanoarchaeota archaeon]MBU4351582.1 hypothetical protein [Nanoarchaeota archaeon]MBU4456623.1 hypothetical protein [Nanoarchaeota archaeon]
MAYKIEDLGKQFEDTCNKYEAFRDNPNDKSEEAYRLSLDTLESMIPIYETGSGKKANPTKQEQVFLDTIKDKSLLERLLKGGYDFQHDLIDNYVDLKKVLEIKKALKDKLFDLDDVLKELGIDINEK